MSFVVTYYAPRIGYAEPLRVVSATLYVPELPSKFTTAEKPHIRSYVMQCQHALVYKRSTMAKAFLGP